MSNPKKLQQVIDILKERGQTDGEIASLIEDLNKASFARMYSEAVVNFTKEDLVSIEACRDQEEANEKIKELYFLRTGKNAKDQAQKFLDTFCQKFLSQVSA